MKKVGIIILNYNNVLSTLKCVKQIKKIAYNNYLLIVVDNCSTDNSYHILEKELDNNIKLIKSDYNGGYAYGNNVGISFALSDNCDYVLILNNDVVLEKNTISELVEYSELNYRAGMVGPAILRADRPTIIQSMGATNNFVRGISLLINSEEKWESVDKSPITPDYLSGACLLVKKEVIRNIGLIPETYFLFYEENEWCLKAKKKGFSVVCLPKTKAYHTGSESINKISGLSYYFMTRNKIIFEKRNATSFQLIAFFCYTVLITILYSIKQPEHIKDFFYYFDGIFNRNKYEYLQNRKID